MKRDPLQYLISHTTERKIKYYIEEYESEREDDEELSYSISSLDELSDLYSSIPIEKDYSNWYIV
jgi:hypothetical protein